MQNDTPPPLVLVVEDGEDLRDVLEAFLASRNYRVIACEGVPEALDALRAQRPDLVLTDVFLGACSGLELITTIRSDFAVPPPIIACSGLPGVEPQALDRGADLFLLKPLVPDTLAQAIAALIGQHQPSSDLLEENSRRSLALRAQNIEAARKVMLQLAPLRAALDEQAERDSRWLPTFLGWGEVVIAVIEGDQLQVLASSDPERWPRQRAIDEVLPLCRHILETNSAFLVPDLAALVPPSAAPAVTPRFVAGFPFIYEGTAVGVLCLVDDRPGRLDPADFALIEDLCNHFSDWLSDGKRPDPRGGELMRRHALEVVVRSEFDRAARKELTVHFFGFASRTRPPDLLAERTLVAELGEERFGLIMTRSTHDRAPADLVAAVRRLRALPGFGGGDLFSIEVGAAPRLGEYMLQFADRRLDDRVARVADPEVERVVVRHEALERAS